jgi:hypothetical protein
MIFHGFKGHGQSVLSWKLFQERRRNMMVGVRYQSKPKPFYNYLLEGGIQDRKVITYLHHTGLLEPSLE